MCASILIKQGLHPKIVSEHLGHGSIEITMNRYGHLYGTDSGRVANALEAAHSDGLVVQNPSRIESAADNTLTNRRDVVPERAARADFEAPETQTAQGL